MNYDNMAEIGKSHSLIFGLLLSLFTACVAMFIYSHFTATRIRKNMTAIRGDLAVILSFLRELSHKEMSPTRARPTSWLEAGGPGETKRLDDPPTPTPKANS